MTVSNIFTNLTEEQRKSLTGIVGDWIADGFTTPPYKPSEYDIFEALDLARENYGGYDTRRNGGSQA